MTNHPIQIPPELLSELLQKAMEEHGTRASTVASVVAHKVAHWAADQMLDACCDWVSKHLPYLGDFLRAAMRPKSLVEQGLEILSPPEGPVLAGTPEYRLTEFQAEVLRAALDRLDKLEAKQ